MSLGPNAYAVVATRGIDSDTEALWAPWSAAGFASSASWGAGRRPQSSSRRLRERGVAAEELARVRTPLGMPIGAQTSEEIAVSILAELMAVRRGAARRPLEVIPHIVTLNL